METSDDIQHIVELEHGFFDDGSPSFYERVVADDASFVIPGLGRIDKSACVKAAEQFEPWHAHELEQLDTQMPAPGTIAVSYHARARRTEDAEPYGAWMSTVWRRRDDGDWELVLHQQTPDSDARKPSP